MLASKLIENTSDLWNAKEYYRSFIKKKNTKSEIITYQPKNLKNPNIVDTKSIITEHPIALHKLSKTRRQAKKVRSNSSLHSDTKSTFF